MLRSRTGLSLDCPVPYWIRVDRNFRETVIRISSKLVSISKRRCIPSSLNEKTA